jgi:5-dehydro-4-deoxyglucarate dehydratase
MVAGRVPVYAGAGGSIAQAKQFAKAAKDAGADGLLLLPPYLVEMPQASSFVRDVAATTDLPVIVYNRNNARFTEASAIACRRSRISSDSSMAQAIRQSRAYRSRSHRCAGG